jgi:LacI family transcriptional regulator
MEPPKTPSIRQLAAELGCSIGAVSMALRDHPSIPVATRERIKKVAVSMGYKVDAHFSQLMAYMRRRNKVHTSCNLAWLYCGGEPRPFHRAPWAIGHLKGAIARADQLGFAIDEIWMTPYTKEGASVTRMLLGRGISGIIIAPPWFQGAHTFVDWSQFASVMVSESSDPPYVSQVSANYFSSMRTAVETALAMGYKRPGYCRTAFFDLLSLGAFSGGFLFAQERIPEADRIPLPPGSSEGDSFKPWFRKYRPDVLITSERDTLQRLGEMGLEVPRDVGLIHLALGADVEDWSGIDQQHEKLGSAAIDIVSAHLNRNERGIPLVRKKLFLDGIWKSGKTTCPPSERSGATGKKKAVRRQAKK